MSAPESLVPRDEPTQCDRIRTWLRKGPVTQEMFDKPTVDGYKPIRRVAARIQDLKELGLVIPAEFEDWTTFKVYRLAFDPEWESELSKPVPLQPVLPNLPNSPNFSNVNMDGEQTSLFDAPSTPHYREAA